MSDAVLSTADLPNVDGKFNILRTDDTNLQGERVAIFYVPVHEAIQWPENPKRHDIGAIVKSIEEYGFRDPPTWDNKLQGLVEGNGRTQALKMMEKQAKETPRGILKHKEGYWCMPILFGIDAKSLAAAQRYAIDHNNLTLMGGEFTLFEISKMWTKDAYVEILKALEDQDEMPVTVDFDDLHLLEKGFEFDPLDDMIDKAEGGDNFSEESGAVFIINVANANILEDVKDTLEAIIDEHPEWDARMSEK